MAAAGGSLVYLAAVQHVFVLPSLYHRPPHQWSQGSNAVKPKAYHLSCWNHVFADSSSASNASDWFHERAITNVADDRSVA